MKEYKRILIVKMSSLGDVIHALPTLYAIRKNWPNAHITWAVHEQFSGPLPGKPWLDEVLFIDKKKLKSISYLWTLRRILHERNFDYVPGFAVFGKKRHRFVFYPVPKRSTAIGSCVKARNPLL